MPDLATQRELVGQAVRELVARGLVEGELGGMISEPSLYTPWTTSFGNSFVAYITGHSG